MLPFGLSSCPRVFMKLLLQVVRHVHSQGHKPNPYIDDLLGASRSYLGAREGCHLLVSPLLSLGYVINLRKSQLEPSQDRVPLGARVQTLLGRVSVPRAQAAVLVGRIASWALSSRQRRRSGQP